MTGHAPFWLDSRDPNTPFPSVTLALHEPNGLLAVGGDLSPQRLLRAYRSGIFPWYSAGQPILWWSPDPRMVLYPAELKLSRSLRKTLRKRCFQVTFDQNFEAVIEGCAAPRSDHQGTWITPEMRAAYCLLHRLGHAHSVEVWQEARLVGGLYGVALGRVFFGESMFARATDASKVGFVHLVQALADWGYAVIDCQVETRHLTSLGARAIPRDDFTTLLARFVDQTPDPDSWSTARRFLAFD